MSSSKKGEPKAEKEFELERALLNEDAKTDLDRLHVPLRLTGLDIAKNFDRFLEVFDSIEQTLYWYRIVIAEERYLEDKYFYCVRMIESVYRNLKLKTEGDEAALGTVKKICEKLSNGKKDCELIKFIKQRVVPIFNKPWSLTSVVKDLKLKYAELKIVQILDEKTINDLRGKHAHGTSRQLSARDYKFMTYSYELLTVLYVLTILESCGIERAFLLRNLKQSHAHSHYFSDEHLAAVTKDLNQV